MDKTSFNININRDESHLNDFLNCWSIFGTRPNKITLYNTYSTSAFNELVSEMVKERNVFTEVIPTDESYIINDKMFVKIDDGLYLSYVIIDRKQENSIINEITFLYKDYDGDFKKIQEIIEKLNECLVYFCEEQGNKLNAISLTPNGLEIEPLDISKLDMDNIDLYYSEKTMKEIDKLTKSIKKSDKGLSILYSERGNGKTSVISYITNKLDRIVIFIPNNMVEHTINNPDFRKFLKKYIKPVIVIDDCEMLFNEAFTKSNIFVNNLLQMVDGLLSDSIEVNIITIFNVDDDEEIDHSLLECNNLIDVIEFQKLSQDESNELSKHLGHDKSYKNKTRLIDIIKKRKSKDTIDIGF